jgi:Flp pilus assembly protein TadG
MTTRRDASMRSIAGMSSADPFLESENGIAAVEFAVIAPMMLLMLAGIFEFGRIYQVYSACNRLATQYTIAWADCSDSPAGTCSTELSAFTSANAIANIAPQLNPSKLTLSMFQVQMSGSTPSVVYSAPSGATLSAAQTSAVQAALSNGASGVVVTATYSHSLAVFSTLMKPFLNSYLTPSYTVVQLKS